MKPKILTLAAITALTLLAIPSRILADTIVDTGAGVSGQGGYSLYNAGTDYQFLGGYFTISSAVTVTSVEGWMARGAGAIDIAIGSNPGTPLFSSTDTTSGDFNENWYGVSALNWSLGAGSYWVTFSPAAGTYGWMPWGAANPLPNYTFNNTNTTGWTPAELGLGIRIMGTQNVPDTSATLVLLSVSLLGLATLRRRFVA